MLYMNYTIINKVIFIPKYNITNFSQYFNCYKANFVVVVVFHVMLNIKPKAKTGKRSIF